MLQLFFGAESIRTHQGAHRGRGIYKACEVFLLAAVGKVSIASLSQIMDVRMPSLMELR
jgi:hypothetical protein